MEEISMEPAVDLSILLGPLGLVIFLDISNKIE